MMMKKRQEVGGRKSPSRRRRTQERESAVARRSRAAKVFSILRNTYTDVRVSLDFTTPFELLIATILSAQCTDARVNMVTPGLFRKYPDPRSFADADIRELEQDIKSTGFYHNKAKSIAKCCKALVEKFDGAVPRTMDDLLTLDGVGRKTANVLLGNAFGVPGIAVDTHVSRLSQRLVFTENEDPAKIESDLMDVFPPEDWTMLCHLLIAHGRKICTAPVPKCEECVVNKLCPSAFTFTRKKKDGPGKKMKGK